MSSNRAESASRSHGRVKWSFMTATIPTHPNLCRMWTRPALSSWRYTATLAPFLISSTCTVNVASTLLRTVLLFRFFAPARLNGLIHTFIMDNLSRAARRSCRLNQPWAVRYFLGKFTTCRHTEATVAYRSTKNDFSSFRTPAHKYRPSCFWAIITLLTPSHRRKYV